MVGAGAVIPGLCPDTGAGEWLERAAVAEKHTLVLSALDIAITPSVAALDEYLLSTLCYKVLINLRPTRTLTWL